MMRFLKGNKSYPPTNIQVFLVNEDNEKVGEANGFKVDMDYNFIEDSECYEDINDLIERYPQVLDEEGQPRIAELYQADIIKDERGKGYGVEMYLEFARRFWDERSGGKPFILIPNQCNLTMEGSNTEDSLRVWRSLSKNTPSSDLCLAILKKPERMSRARRLVAKYNASQVSFHRTSGWDIDSDSLTSVIQAYSEDKLIGEFEATLSSVDMDDLQEYVCYEEMAELVSENPSLLGSDGKVCVVEVISSFLDRDYRGRKCGIEGYLRLARYVFENRTQRKPFLFIPNYCFASRTSDKALRVWKSLARRYPSRYDVVVINKS